MPPDLSKHLARIRQAIDRRSWDLALTLSEECQDVDPTNVDVYKLHSEAAKKRAKEVGKTGLFGINVGMPTLSKDPHKQLSAALKRVGKSPNLKHFADAGECAMKVYKANAKAMVDVAIYLYEEAKATGLFDQNMLWNLSHLYHDKFKDDNGVDNDLLEKALKTMAQLEAAVASHPEAGRTIKNWEAERSMLKRQGGVRATAGTADYRNQLSNEERSRRQEAMNRLIRTDAEAAEVLGYIEADLKATPDDKSLWLKKADVHLRTMQFAESRSALEQVQRIDPHDFQVIMRLGELISAEFDQRIKAAEAAGEDASLLKQDKNQHEIAEYRRRVERQPTDMNHRYQLAVRLITGGEIDAAASELQRSVADPKLRRPANRLLGHCMTKKGLFDLAIKQYSNYLDLTEDDMGDEAKLVRYNRGRLYERQGKKNEARGDFSRLVEIDISFQDAADRLSKLDEGEAASA